MTPGGSWALITGASSGLGAEFATQLAAQGYGLVLVGRDAKRLREHGTRLSETYEIPHEVLVADLHNQPDRHTVITRLTDTSAPVSVLVNNAGYGISGDLGDSDWQEELDHLSIHVSAPLELTKAALPGMVERGHGRIIMVSSVAGYLARGTYSAHKAWGLSLARSLSATYRASGIVVTAVAPGFTRTEFHQRMDMNVRGVPSVLWLSAERVVRVALRASAKGKAVSIPSLRYKALVAISALMPRKLHQSSL
jgi:uncharacterized protein